MPVPITPVTTSSSSATLLVKNSSGFVYGAYALNLSSTAGFFILIDANVIPVDGGITPKTVVPIAGNGMASIQGSDNAPMFFHNGIVAILSSNASPFTKTTTGALAGFMSCQAQ